MLHPFISDHPKQLTRGQQTPVTQGPGKGIPSRSGAVARHAAWYRVLPLLLTLAALLVAAMPARAARLALVIGNKDYTVGPLKNPLNDAEDMEALLRGLGFQVTLVRNLRRDDIGRTVNTFANRIRPGDDVLVFYAGHGLQVKGVNFLPAVDARIQVEEDVALNSLNLNELLQRLDEQRAGVRLLLIDACRDNPYSRGWRSNARGLARVEGAPSGTLMHFATRPGGVAADGQGRNGTYTAELLKHLRSPGLPVESVLKRVASSVRQATGGAQQPWTEGALDGEFFFAAGELAASTLGSPAPSLPMAEGQPRPGAQPRVVQILDPGKLQSTPSTSVDELRAAGLTSELASVVHQRLRESSTSWPVSLRTYSSRWADENRVLSMLKSYRATLVVELKESVIVRIPAADNQDVPSEIRPMEDFFMMVRKDGVRY